MCIIFADFIAVDEKFRNTFQEVIIWQIILQSRLNHQFHYEFVSLIIINTPTFMTPYKMSNFLLDFIIKNNFGVLFTASFL